MEDTEEEHAYIALIPKKRNKLSSIRKKRKVVVKENILNPRREDCLEKTAYLPFRHKMPNKSELFLPYLEYSNKVKQSERKWEPLIPDRKMIVDKKNMYPEQFKLPLIHNVQSIIDIDKSFYKICDDYHRKNSLSYKSMKKIYNDIVILKYETAMKNDQILLIDKNRRAELKKYEQVKLKLEESIKQFDTFVLQDYEKSMDLLEELEKTQHLHRETNMHYVAIASKTYYLRSEIENLNYRVMYLQKFEYYLYNLSPLWWRRQNSKRFDSIINHCVIEDTTDDCFSLIYQNMQNDPRTSCREVCPLFFGKPEDLMELLNYTEKQCYDNLCYTNLLSERYKQENEYNAILKIDRDAKNSGIRDAIEDLQNTIDQCLSRASELEKQFRELLNGFFYEVTASKRVLKMVSDLDYYLKDFFHLEFGDESLFSQTCLVEKIFVNYFNRLDSVDKEFYKSYVLQCMALDRKTMKEAILASRRLREFENFNKAMQKLTNPPAKFKRFKSYPPKSHSKSLEK